MWGSKIESAVGWIKSIRNLAEAAKGLTKTGATTPSVGLIQTEDSEEVVQLPGYLRSASTLSTSKSTREQFPVDLVINTSLNDDLADCESSRQEIHESSVTFGFGGNFPKPPDSRVSIALAGSHELQFDLDPR